MELAYHTTFKIMNVIYWVILDKYGADEAPYEYGAGRRSKTVKIELPMWRYDADFINELFLKHDLTMGDFSKDDTLFLDAHEDVYGFKA